MACVRKFSTAVPVFVLAMTTFFTTTVFAQTACLQTSTEFSNQPATSADTLVVLVPSGLTVDRLLLAGTGVPQALPRHQAETIGAALSVRINASNASTVELNTLLLTDTEQAARIAAEIAHGLDLRNYRFDRYKSEPAPRPAQRSHWQGNAKPSTGTHRHGQRSAERNCQWY